MNIYLIRHGEVDKKYLNRYVGSTDVGLSYVGRQQAKRIAEYFQDIAITKLYISPRKRVKQTATPLIKAKKLSAIEDMRLSEIDFGPWEGKTSKQIVRMLPKDLACSQITSGGELYADFAKRVRSFVKDLKTKATDETVCIIAHKGVIREMYKNFLEDENLIVDQAYGCVNHLVLENNRASVVMMNKQI